MKRIDPSLFVCSPQQAQQLITLGILPAGFFCYELKSFTPAEGAPEYEFAGEYFDQHEPIPAWTLEELNVLIGGYFSKPDMPDAEEWTANRNMLHYILYFPDSLKSFLNGAQASAAFLIFLLQNDHITAAQANERLEAFMNGTHYNPIDSDHFPAKKK